MSKEIDLSNELHNIVLIGVKKVINNNQVIIGIRGSGFILNNGDKQYIVTCAHVFQGIPESERNAIFCGLMSPETRDSDDVKKYEFVDISFLSQHPDQRRDICFFTFNDTSKEIKKYGYSRGDLVSDKELSKIKILDEITFTGFPLANELMQMGMGITLAASKSVISAIKYSSLDKKIDFLLIDKFINPGSSGSPVFLGNKIIGIASGTLNHTHQIGQTLINVPVNIGLIRTSNYINELLSDEDEE